MPNEEYYCFGTKFETSKSEIVENVPLTKMWKLWSKSAKAIEKQRWKLAEKRLIILTEYIDVVIGWRQVQFGKPHLDGIYRFGTMEIERAPDEIKDLVHNFNQKLQEAKGHLGR